MKWHILGAGSIGCLWAARLAIAGEDVRLIMRSARLDSFQLAGSLLTLTGLDNNSQQIELCAETANQHTKITRLILACKAYSAVDAIVSVKPRLTSATQVILLQNGIGSQQAVRQLIPDCQLWVGSTTEGAYLAAPFHCIQAGSGLTLLGPPANTASPKLPQQLQAAGIPCQPHADMDAVLWRKLAINCLINPLTVLLDCHNGQLLKQQSQLSPLIAELQTLLKASGHAKLAVELPNSLHEVLQATAANVSSMLQDVRLGRRTEISYMSGYALKQCQQLGISAPALGDLHQQLQHRLRQLGLPDD